MDSQQITDVVKHLMSDKHVKVEKVTLVGCKTVCSKQGASLASDVDAALRDSRKKIDVKGYGGLVTSTTKATHTRVKRAA